MAGENDAVIDGFLAASRVLVALTARSLVELDAEVTLVQCRGLVVLASKGPRRTVDLAIEMEVAPSTITRMCDRLVRKGLVQRYRRVDDRRAAWVGLTVAGRELVGEVMRRRRLAIARFVGTMPVADRETLARALDAFAVAAGEAPETEWWQRWQDSAIPPADVVTA